MIGFHYICSAEFQVPRQVEQNSCGIIVLHAIENIMSYAYECKFDFEKLNAITGDNIKYSHIVASTRDYRTRVQHYLTAVFALGPRFRCASSQPSSK